MNLTQLIIGDASIYLPETSKDRYKCYETVLSERVEMISGRMVEEVRGIVQKIEWSCDYLPDALWRQLSAVLRSGTSFPVVYLPDHMEYEGEDSMLSSIFLCESMENPTFAFSRYGKPFWHNIAFTLREVSPHA